MTVFCPRRWGVAGAILAAAVAALALLSSAGAGKERPNLVIVTIDTLREDRVSAYGWGRATTPNLDRLAERGVLFERPYAQIPETLPSHASMMTGRYPYSLRCERNWTPLSDSAETLAEILRARGYATAAFVSAAVLARPFNMEQGFEVFSDNLDVRLSEQALLELPYRGLWRAQAVFRGESEVPAEATVSRALWWLKHKGREPFFLWVHLYSPHSPYLAPEPYRHKFKAEGDGLLEQLDALYDGEVAYADAQTGRLLDALRGRVGKRTIVCVLSDHGEGLGHKDYLLHVQFTYEPELRIPWIMAGPGIPQGKRVPSLVQTVDLAPTLLELLGVGALPGMQGKSLVPLMQGKVEMVNEYVAGQRGVQTEPLRRLTLVGPPVALHAHQRWLVVDGESPMKLIYGRGPGPEAVVVPELYDLRADPEETRNLAQDETATLSEMYRRLTEVERMWEKEAAAPEAARQLPPEIEQRLRALGYIR